LAKVSLGGHGIELHLVAGGDAKQTDLAAAPSTEINPTECVIGSGPVAICER
jgi:hypothetical protein